MNRNEMEQQEAIVVGVLGQWASGKTVAARTLIQHLGGDDAVVFIADRALIASQTLDHILNESEVTYRIQDDGRQRFDGELATLWLGPREDFGSVDLNRLSIQVADEVHPEWHDRARVELGRQILERSGHGKPIVVEAAFGPDVEDLGGAPFRLSVSDLLTKLDEAGVQPGQVKWIMVEARHDTRSARNQKRPVKVPAEIFDRFAADGGDLGSKQERRLAEQGLIITRVSNDHDDIGKFRAAIIAAFEGMQ